MGSMAEQRGRPIDALQHAQQALALFRAAGHRLGEAKALNAVGWCHTLLGEHEQAVVHCGHSQPPAAALFPDELAFRLPHLEVGDVE